MNKLTSLEGIAMGDIIGYRKKPHPMTMFPVCSVSSNVVMLKGLTSLFELRMRNDRLLFNGIGLSDDEMLVNTTAEFNNCIDELIVL